MVYAVSNFYPVCFANKEGEPKLPVTQTIEVIKPFVTVIVLPSWEVKVPDAPVTQVGGAPAPPD